MNSWTVLAIGLVFGTVLNFTCCVVTCDPQRRKGVSPLEFLWVLYCVNFGGSFVLAPAWVTVEILQRWPDWTFFGVCCGPVLPILIMLPLAWRYVRWRPYVGR